MTKNPNFIHAADLHLGVPLQSLGACLGHSSEKLAELRQLASRSLDHLVEAVLEQESAFVVLAGDVYDSADREVSSQLTFERALRRLRDEGRSGPVPVFVVHGNHDPLVDGFRAAAKLPDNVHVFGSGSPSSVTVNVAGVGEVNVAGVSFSSQAESENLVRRFNGLSIDPALPTVGVVHANLEGTTGHDPYAPCSKGDLETSPIGYWALGHVHDRAVAAMGPGRWWAYPGNLQGRSTKPTECGPKGVLRVGFGESGFDEPEFLACDSVRFERLDLDVSGVDDLAAMIQLVTDAAIVRAETANGRPVLAAIDLVGRTPIHDDLRRFDRGELLDQCREEMGERLGLGELLRVRDSTLPEVDLHELIGGTGLLPEVLRYLEALESGTDAALSDAISDRLLESLDKSIAAVISPDEILGDLLAASRQILIDELLEAVVI